MALSRNNTTLTVSAATTLDCLDALISQPQEDQRRRLGTFFVLVKVDEILTLVPWLHTLAMYLEESYYQTLQADPEITVERALGVVRQRTKVKLQQLTQETRTITMDGVHYCFGALKGRNLSVVHSGDVHAYLMHNRRVPGSAPKIQWIDITGTPAQATKSSRAPLPAASSVVSGLIGDDDTVVVVTESIIETLGLAKLERTLGNAPLEGAKALLERDLKNVGSRLGFGALFLRRPLLPAEHRNRENVTKSMANLLNQETGTAELLTPQNVSGVKRLLQPRKHIPLPIAEAEANQPLRPVRPRLNVRSIGKSVGIFLRQLGALLTTLAKELLFLPIRLARVLTSTHERSALAKTILEWPDTLATEILARIRHQPRSSQRLLIVSFLFAFLFLQSLVFLVNRDNRTASSMAQQEMITTIQDALDQADASIIYHNETEAVRQLAVADEKLINLPQETTAEKERWQLLTARANDIRTRLMHLVVIAAPDQLSTLTDQIQNANGLAFTSAGLLAYDTSAKTFATINEENGQVTSLSVTAGDIGNLERSTNADGGAISFLTDKAQVATLQQGALNSVTIQNPASTAAAIALYRDRLYLLDPQGRQIWRHQKTNGNFGAGVPWVQGVADNLTSSSSLAIDGDVYVLAKNGSIVKFASGVAQNWQGSTPINPPQNATRLQIITDASYLFAMDADSKRLFVWNKETGELLHQFSFPNIPQLRDFTVKDKGSTLYLLSEKAIYKTKISL